MSEYKIGDKFEIVKTFYLEHGLQEGDIAEFVRYGYGKKTVVLKPAGSLSHKEFYFHIDVENGHVSTARPLKTEADKRGAKLGDGITFKPTGAKGIFWKSICGTFGEEWYLPMADGNILTAPPSQIRLDHEPEYREIPFSEATHEQRMDVSALRFDGTPVEQIFRFDNGEYMFTISACKAVANAWNILKVRIPT